MANHLGSANNGAQSKQLLHESTALGGLIMVDTERRTFLKGAGVGLAALALGTGVASGEENSKIIVGVIGTGGMGGNHVRTLAGRQDIEIAYICDVDQQRADANAQAVQSEMGKAP